MLEITILYWRDIPAQLIAGRGRKAIKYKLPEKYEKAIDRCAMKNGAKDSETYLEGWRKFVFTTTNSGPNVLKGEATKLEEYYSNEKLEFLVNNGGWNTDSPHDN